MYRMGRASKASRLFTRMPDGTYADTIRQAEIGKDAAAAEGRRLALADRRPSSYWAPTRRPFPVAASGCAPGDRPTNRACSGWGASAPGRRADRRGHMDAACAVVVGTVRPLALAALALRDFAGLAGRRAITTGDSRPESWRAWSVESMVWAVMLVGISRLDRCRDSRTWSSAGRRSWQSGQ